MKNITVQKLTISQVILPDGTIETYKPHVVPPLTMILGGEVYVVLIDGKVGQSLQGHLDVFQNKAAALCQAEFYNVLLAGNQ